jgi:hypothetical protein
MKRLRILPLLLLLVAVTYNVNAQDEPSLKISCEFLSD